VKGKFIVLEGIDGAGTETQSKKLVKYLKSKDKKVLFITYPDYGPNKENPTKPIGKLIHEWLHKKYDFDVKVQFLLYSVDMIKDIKKIRSALKSGKIIVADRYFTSTLAYQGLKGFPIRKGLEYAKMFGIVRPNLIIYLEITPETSIKRKLKEKGRKIDRHEKDKKFLKRLVKFYRRLVNQNVFGKWVTINGEKSKREVFEDIKRIVDKFIL
jgi:dTMP kinase